MWKISAYIILWSIAHLWAMTSCQEYYAVSKPISSLWNMMRLKCERTTDSISCISASHKMWDTGPKPGFQNCSFVERDVYIWKLEWASAASDARGRRVSLQFGIQFLFCWQNNNGSVGPQIDGIPLSRPKRNISRDFSDAGTFVRYFLLHTTVRGYADYECWFTQNLPFASTLSVVFIGLHCYGVHWVK